MIPRFGLLTIGSLLFALALAAGFGQTANAQRADDAPAQISIAASGDILFHQKVVDSAASSSWDSVLEGLSQVTREDDITFVNVETPLVDDIRRVRGAHTPPILGAPTASAAALANAGVDVASFANNHVFDQEAVGALRTLDALRDAGIATGGAVAQGDPFEPVWIRRGEQEVAFFCATDRINQGPGREASTEVAWLERGERDEVLLEHVREVRPRADLVVLSIHWSFDFWNRPRDWQRRRARAFIDAGVDLILGTGPHVLQPVERVDSPRGDAVIAFSLGNLISNQGQRYRLGRHIARSVHPAIRLPDTRDAVLLRTTFRVQNGRVRALPIEADALWTENGFWAWVNNRRRGTVEIQLKRLQDLTPPLMENRLAAIRRALGPEVQVRP